MKAQTVKNAVIVPVGAKGGFVVKRGEVRPRGGAATRPSSAGCSSSPTTGSTARSCPPRRRAARRRRPLPRGRRRQGDGAFSDLANELAAARLLARRCVCLRRLRRVRPQGDGHHRARGVDLVRAHFRDLGIDADTADLTVAGIGDMSGDVFGNGMLRSSQLRLVAAFDHRHVFVDPDPDPAASFAERQRLFDLPRRRGPTTTCGALARAAGCGRARPSRCRSRPRAGRARARRRHRPLTPDELVSAVLRAPVDLLWNGGIGTYVKATTETSRRRRRPRERRGAHRRDRAARPGRRRGREPRIHPTGPRRVRAAGGRINTDAIDNSAGVDCSDHEVNIKILLHRRSRSASSTVPRATRSSCV